MAATDNVLHSNVKGEEFSMPLPEVLVERILSMVPFPQIFKARALSKSWHARLSSISSQDDEAKKLLAVSFQKLVCESSNKWMTSSPVILFPDFLLAYDRAALHWRKIPTLSVLPYEVAMTVRAHMQEPGFRPAMMGALLFIPHLIYQRKMFVVNIFTGSWKELQLPYTGFSIWNKLVSSKEMYKVIMLCTDVGYVRAWIYDSKLGDWRSKTLEKGQHDFKVGWYDVYLNGVIYVLVHAPHVLFGFLAFDVENETFDLLQMPPLPPIDATEHVLFLQLEACNGSVYVVVPAKTLVLLEADLVPRRWSKVIHDPPVDLKFEFYESKISSDGDCFFFYKKSNFSAYNIRAYNVRREKWSCLPRILMQAPRFTQTVGNSSFQPGMNPFLDV